MYCQLGSNLMRLRIQAVNNDVDTTSAGDSFNRGYMGARIEGNDLKVAIGVRHVIFLCRIFTFN